MSKQHLAKTATHTGGSNISKAAVYAVEVNRALCSTDVHEAIAQYLGENDSIGTKVEQLLCQHLNESPGRVLQVPFGLQTIFKLGCVSFHGTRVEYLILNRPCVRLCGPTFAINLDEASLRRIRPILLLERNAACKAANLSELASVIKGHGRPLNQEDLDWLQREIERRTEVLTPYRADPVVINATQLASERVR